MLRHVLATLLRSLEPTVWDATHGGASAISLLRGLPSSGGPIRPVSRCAACSTSFVQAEGDVCFRCARRAAPPAILSFPAQSKSATRRRRRS